jgi:hypothetical protein
MLNCSFQSLMETDKYLIGWHGIYSCGHHKPGVPHLKNKFGDMVANPGDWDGYKNDFINFLDLCTRNLSYMPGSIVMANISS